MQMGSCEDKLKGKTAHFRLPSASQKRACLSSLMFVLERAAICLNARLTRILGIIGLDRAGEYH